MKTSNIKLANFLLLISMFICVPCVFAAQGPLPGAKAGIEYHEGEVDTFNIGVKLFTDRDYKLAECPEWLKGQKFLRNTIVNEMFFIAEDGVLTLLTPTIHTNKVSGSQVKDLEQRGFVHINQTPDFQLFGKGGWDRVRVYQKNVKAGDYFSPRKYVVVVGFSSAKEIQPEPWEQNRGERLYNGIVLPERWPPRTINPTDLNPMPVPYLDHPPAIIPIDVGRQLFVDNFLIEETTLNRSYHKPRKYSGNPVLKPESALELNGEFNDAAVPKSGGLWWDPKEKIFKLWYEAGWINTICYATSKDGFYWERPELDVVPGTNQVLPTDLKPDSWTVIPDWDATDPQQRYKMYMHPPGSGGAICMTSPDGIHWINRVKTAPSGDRSTAFYNPFRKKWVYSLRSGWAGRGRSRHYWESDDFLKGAAYEVGAPAFWVSSDNQDIVDHDNGGHTPQLYCLDAVAYESIMLGMFEIHHGPPNQECAKVGLPKITELNLAYSRDGFHWHRPDRNIHIRAERWGSDKWDTGYVQPLGNICTIQGDTMFFYYSAFRGSTNRTDKSFLKTGMYHDGAMGVAFLRRDGFVSMDGGADSGYLLTRPITFSGSHLFVNTSARGGELRAEIIDDSTGKTIEPFTIQNCNPVSVDSTIADVTWRGAKDLKSLRGKPVRFRFTLKNGSLYAFWVSRDSSGRSDGYVAGGGPGYTGMTDTVGREKSEE